MNIQETFDIIVTHLLTQNKCSRRMYSGYAGSCAYRGANNLKCAVGCLISDEAYYPELEAKLADNTFVIDALEKSGVNVDSQTIQLLLKCQQIHDNYHEHHWTLMLEEVAMNFDLKFNPPTKEL